MRWFRGAGRHRPADAVEDRRSQQELADRLRLALQDLGKQVVGDGPLAARKLRDEALRRPRASSRESAASRGPAAHPSVA